MLVLLKHCGKFVNCKIVESLPRAKYPVKNIFKYCKYQEYLKILLTNTHHTSTKKPFNITLPLFEAVD